MVLALWTLSVAGCLFNTESYFSAEAKASTAGHGEAAEEDHGESGHGAAEGSEHHPHKILVTTPVRKNVISTQQYVCQIHSCQHIEVRALEGGYLPTLIRTFCTTF